MRKCIKVLFVLFLLLCFITPQTMAKKPIKLTENAMAQVKGAMIVQEIIALSYINAVGFQIFKNPEAWKAFKGYAVCGFNFDYACQQENSKKLMEIEVKAITNTNNAIKGLVRGVGGPVASFAYSGLNIAKDKDKYVNYAESALNKIFPRTDVQIGDNKLSPINKNPDIFNDPARQNLTVVQIGEVKYNTIAVDKSSLSSGPKTPNVQIGSSKVNPASSGKDTMTPATNQTNSKNTAINILTGNKGSNQALLNSGQGPMCTVDQTVNKSKGTSASSGQENVGQTAAIKSSGGGSTTKVETKTQTAAERIMSRFGTRENKFESRPGLREAVESKAEARVAQNAKSSTVASSSGSIGSRSAGQASSSGRASSSSGSRSSGRR